MTINGADVNTFVTFTKNEVQKDVKVYFVPTYQQNMASGIVTYAQIHFSLRSTNGGGYAVTWAFGHLIQLAMPDGYGIRGFVRDSLPVIPETFTLVPRQVKAPLRHKPFSSLMRIVGIRLFKLVWAMVYRWYAIAFTEKPYIKQKIGRSYS